jgi:hypothetical protein
MIDLIDFWILVILYIFFYIFSVAVKEIPNFLADPNTQKGEVMPHHRATIHLNCEHSDLIHDAFIDAQQGRFSTR